MEIDIMCVRRYMALDSFTHWRFLDPRYKIRSDLCCWFHVWWQTSLVEFFGGSREPSFVRISLSVLLRVHILARWCCGRFIICFTRVVLTLKGFSCECFRHITTWMSWWPVSGAIFTITNSFAAIQIIFDRERAISFQTQILRTKTIKFFFL